MFFFFNDTATTEIYTLSLHDALPISFRVSWTLAADARWHGEPRAVALLGRMGTLNEERDRKSTRLNSSHSSISYAVFCLKKKNRCNVRTISDNAHDKSTTHRTVWPNP